MLQIATGMYFGGREVHETTHRAVFHSNATTLRSDPIELPFGRLLFSSGFPAISAVTIEAIDRLPKEDEDGSGSIMIATGGAELLDDVAAVFSFWGNVLCSRHLSVVERLLPRTPGRSPGRGPSAVLRRTFDPQVTILPDEFEDLRKLGDGLLGLRRAEFEAAMRAIRTVVAARMIVGDDPALAYTLFVAALEALAQLAITTESLLDWNRYDSRKRSELDPVLAVLAPAAAEAVRAAILRSDQRSGLPRVGVTSELWCPRAPLKGCSPCPSRIRRSSAMTWSGSPGAVSPAFGSRMSPLISGSPSPV